MRLLPDDRNNLAGDDHIIARQRGLRQLGKLVLGFKHDALHV